MDLREALYTTRSMRRMKPDPIPMDVQMRILDAAVRAPSGGNFQSWRFLLVDDRELRAKLAPIYRSCISQLWTTVYAERIAAARARPEAPESRSLLRMIRSADHLADHFAEVPLLLFGFAGMGDTSGGSIFQAVWSAMLAARGEGVGSVLTQVFSMHRGNEVNRLLRVREEQGWHCACCVALGYPTGRWGVAPRRPAHEVAYRNTWGQPVGFQIPRPLWP